MAMRYHLDHNVLCKWPLWPPGLNLLRPRQNGSHFPDDIFKFIFLNKNVWISLNISLKFVPEIRINNIPALVQIKAWHGPGNKPLSDPMLVNLLEHICVTHLQWVNGLTTGGYLSTLNHIVNWHPLKWHLAQIHWSFLTLYLRLNDSCFLSTTICSWPWNDLEKGYDSVWHNDNK